MNSIKASFKNVHPLVVLSLGIFIGATIVGLLFFYRLVSPGDYESASMRSKKAYPKTQQSQQYNAPSSMPEPTAGRSMPEPTAGRGR